MPTGARRQPSDCKSRSNLKRFGRRSIARRAALRLATACSLAALSLAISRPAQAGGSHADVDYPPPTQLEVAKINRGGFGRLFPLGVPLPAGADGVVVPLLEHPSSRIDLVRLGRAMVPDAADAAPGAGAMPLGYVFLGQFIDHDLTFDTQTSFDETVDPRGLENARTPDLDLDCVYGGGPERSPHLFEAETPYMRVGAVTVESDDERTRRHDLLRVPMGMTALIGDPRNDENLVISQMQAAFVAHHNRMVDRIVEEQLREPAQTIAATLDELVKEAEAIARGPGDDASKAFALGSAAVGTDGASRSAPGIDHRPLSVYGVGEDEYDGRDALFERLVLDADDRVRTTLVLRETPLRYYVLQEAAEFGIAETVEGDGTAMLAPLPSKLAPPAETGDEADAAPNGGVTNEAAGAVLGSVGGTLVGEVLLGLIDHYRLTTGGGIDRNVDVSGYADLGPEGVPTRDGAQLPESERALALTETVLPDGERRYFLARFLRDAGVAEPVENDRVCLAPAHLPSNRCGEREDSVLDLASQ